MPNILRCQRCASYGLTQDCDCGGKRTTVRPAKYSPDDPNKEHRQTARLKQLGQP